MAAENSYKDIYDHGPIPMWFYDSRSLRFLSANDSAVRLYGYSVEEFLAMSILDIHPKEDWETVRGIVATHGVGFQERGQWRHLRKDGTIVDVEISSSSMTFQGVPAMLVMVRDVSDEKRLNNALRRSEERFRRMFEENNTVMLMFDIASGIVFDGNPAAASFYGYSREVLKTMNIRDIVSLPEEDLARELDLVVSRHSNRKIKSLHRLSSGEIRQVDVHATPLEFDGRMAVFSIIFDSTNEHRARSALAESEARLRAVIDNLPFDIWLCDQDGRYVLQNSAAVKLWGNNVGKLPEEVGFPEKMLQEFLATNSRALAGETVTNETQYVHDGELRYYLSVLSPVQIGGRNRGFVGMNIDVTERTLAQENLKLSLKEKEALLREVHHRVKNNLQVVSSLLHIQTQQFDDPRTRMVFEESQHRIRAMALVHEKLYHSDNLSNINFGEYLESVVGQLIRSYSREGIRLALSLESIEMDVEVAIPCGLVVNELVTNALKHAFPDDGTGTISVGLRRLSDRIIELTVADDGIGIPADADIRNATSMGLTLVQALTEQMSGDVRIERTAGTRFVVEFST